MEIKRTRPRSSQSSQAVDGFFFKPQRPPGHAVPRRSLDISRTSNTRGATGTSNAGGGRVIGDFRRPDGFYAAPRRPAGPGSLASPGRSHAQVGEYAPVAPMAAQFDEEIHSGRHRGKKLSRKEKKQAKRDARRHESKFKKFGRYAFRTTAVMVILVLAIGGVLFGKGYFKLKKVFNGTSTAAALQANVDPTKLKGEGDGRVNILMLGIGGEQHSGGDLTDTLMIASVDPVNNQAILFSVPRDMWVKMPNNYVSNYQKINAAYESGKYKYLGKQDMSNTNAKAIEAGFAAADSTVERVMGVPIHYNVLVNFHAFSQAIDTVGGITIDAPEQLYDPTMAWENGWSPILAKKGINEFNGKKALNYVRSRETSSDFARGQRQRAVMLALKDKVMNAGTLANPVKISNLMSAFGDNVKTDISLADMQRMVQIAGKIPSNQVQSVGLTDTGNNFLTTGNINGLSVVQPRAGLEDYTAIQAFVRSKLKDGYISQENASIAVLNGTFTPGLASTKGDELKTYGYNIATVANAPTDDYDKTIIVDLSGGKKKYTLNYLKKRFNVTTVATTVPQGIVAGTSDIVIILGTDATVATQN